MKKLLLLGMLVGMIGWLPAVAQVLDGMTYWGGTVGFSGTLGGNHPVNGDRSRRYGNHTIVPEIQWGKAINSKTVIGLGTRYTLMWNGNRQTSSQPNSYNGSNRFIRQSVAILPFIRRYKTLGNRWALFLHAEAGPAYSWDRNKNKGTSVDTQTSNYWQYSLNVRPGVVYFFPGKKISLEGYVDFLNLGAKYIPLRPETNQARQITVSLGSSTSFPSYFALRLAKNISPNSVKL